MIGSIWKLVPFVTNSEGIHCGNIKQLGLRQVETG